MYFASILQAFLVVQSQASSISTQFSLSPYNEYDSYYTSLVRSTLAKFHVNLSKGLYSANGPLVSPSTQWNVNEPLILGRSNWVAHLTTFNVSFHGLQVPDTYHIVDGHVGAILYHLQGTQTGQYGTIPDTGRRINVLGAELMVFDTNAQLDSLMTVEELGVTAEQLTGLAKAPQTGNITVATNAQTRPEHQAQLRATLGSIHTNFNTGNNSANLALVTEDVQIIADSNLTSGPAAFTSLIATHVMNGFPDLVVHVDYILADGHLGLIEYVWQGTHSTPYTALNGSMVSPSGKMVRVREMMFLEFDDGGLITKVVRVHDESVISKQLMEDQEAALYPLYP